MLYKIISDFVLVEAAKFVKKLFHRNTKQKLAEKINLFSYLNINILKISY